jgi:hypothetical protein
MPGRSLRMERQSLEKANCSIPSTRRREVPIPEEQVRQQRNKVLHYDIVNSIPHFFKHSSPTHLVGIDEHNSAIPMAMHWTKNMAISQPQTMPAVPAYPIP